MTAPTLTIDEALAKFDRLFTRARRQHAAPAGVQAKRR